MPWELKKNEDGNVVIEEGKPVYINPDGEELALDPPGMYQKILDLGTENKNRREESKALSEKMKMFENIEDLDDFYKKAVKAIEDVANFNDGDWLKAEKVDKMKREMKEAYEDQEKTLKRSFGEKETSYMEDLAKKEAQIRKLTVSNQFATSPFFSGSTPKTILTADIAESYFGKHFRVEEQNGEPILRAYYGNGDPVYSREKPGEPATFDEAMGIIWDQYPGKERLMASGRSGSGGTGGSGSAGGEDDDLSALEKKYAEAQERKDTQTMIVLKNQIMKLRNQRKAA